MAKINSDPEIKNVKLSDVKPAPYNPREISAEAMAGLRHSMEKFGLVDLLIINKRNMQIISGHQRFKILQEQKIKSVPAIMVDVDDITELSMNVTMNSQHIVGHWTDALAPIIEKIKADNPDDYINLRLRELSEQILREGGGKPGLTDDDAVPEAPEMPLTQPGDIYFMGEHRLLCGDSTDEQHVAKLMNGQKADMVFTDPPYGVGYSGGIQFTNDGVKKGAREKLKNDDVDVYAKIVPIVASLCVGPCYMWFPGSRAKNIYNSIDGVGDIHALIIWKKNGGYAAMNSHYKQKHEPCLYWKAKGQSLSWIGSSTENTVWEIDKDMVNKLHPTQKPVALAEKAIRNHKSILVLDLFLGSGSTMIACEKINRICYGMELDPHYCDVIVKRWEEYTGKKAQRIEAKKD